jgi:hypothetical protein
MSARTFSILGAAAFAAVLGLATGADSVQAAQLDMSNPDDVFRVGIRFACSEKEGVNTLYWWKGRMYGRREGEPTRHLFDVHGMNIRQCRMHTDPVRGVGYRSVSREVMFYIDPKTGEVARTWDNPWTGETVDVIHVANDPVNMSQKDGTPRIYWSRDEQGKSTVRMGDYVLKDGVVLEGGGAARLFYTNPLGGDYQEYVGGTYHAMEFGTFSAPAAEALDADDPQIDEAVLSWGRVSNWLPWMKMGDRPGVVIFHTAGLRLSDYSQLPAVVREEIERNYPQYREPPPLDDTRPNETSWTVFKRHIDAQRKNP